MFRSADVVELGTLHRRFSIRANDFFVGVCGGKLFDTLDRQAPHCELRFVPEGDGDEEALREGRIDLSISNTRPLTPEVKIQNLFSTHFVGLVREDHPLFNEEITAERFAGFSYISMSRRGIARGPIDTALNALGLERRVAVIAPSFHAAMFALSLLLPSSPTIQASLLAKGPPASTHPLHLARDEPFSLHRKSRLSETSGTANRRVVETVKVRRQPSHRRDQYDVLTFHRGRNSSVHCPRTMDDVLQSAQ